MLGIGISKPPHCLRIKSVLIQGLSGKSPAIVNIMEWFANQCNLESELGCTCVNNDNFTVLVIGGGRHC